MGFLSSIAPVLGGIGGFMVGGPAGAAVGSGIGGQLGGALDSGGAYDTSGQERAAKNSLELQERMYREGVKRSQPFYDVGVSSLGTLERLMGLKGGDTSAVLMADPSYQFRLGEGEKAIERAMASRGKTFSPEAVKALGDYSQGMASTEYGNVYNRLANLAGMGQTSGAQQSALGSQYGSQYGQTVSSLADAQVAARQAQAAQGQSMFGNLAQLGMTAAMMGSDRRLKENVKKVGEKNGHNIYHFSYIGDDKVYEGVMAQEVLEKNPEAVGELNGYLAVDYAKLGLEMKEVN